MPLPTHVRAPVRRRPGVSRLADRTSRKSPLAALRTVLRRRSGNLRCRAARSDAFGPASEPPPSRVVRELLPSPPPRAASLVPARRRSALRRSPADSSRALKSPARGRKRPTAFPVAPSRSKRERKRLPQTPPDTANALVASYPPAPPHAPRGLPGRPRLPSADVVDRPDVPWATPRQPAVSGSWSLHLAGTTRLPGNPPPGHHLAARPSTAAPGERPPRRAPSPGRLPPAPLPAATAHAGAG